MRETLQPGEVSKVWPFFKNAGAQTLFISDEPLNIDMRTRCACGAIATSFPYCGQESCCGPAQCGPCSEKPQADNVRLFTPEVEGGRA